MGFPFELKFGVFVAVYSNEEPFFLAKIINPNNRDAIKIKWLEKHTKTKKGIKYGLSYEDSIHVHCIICKVNLTKKTRFSFLLTLKEEAKILDAIQSSSNTENDTINHAENKNFDNDQYTHTDNETIITQKENQNATSPIMTNENNLPENQSPISTANIVNRINFNECQSICNVSPPSLNEKQRQFLLGSKPADKVKLNDLCIEFIIDKIFQNLNFNETESIFNGPLLCLNNIQKEQLLGKEDKILEQLNSNEIDMKGSKPLDQVQVVKLNAIQSVDEDFGKELLMSKEEDEEIKINHSQNIATAIDTQPSKIIIHSNLLINTKSENINSTQEMTYCLYDSLTDVSKLQYPQILETKNEKYTLETFAAEPKIDDLENDANNSKCNNMKAKFDEDEQTPTPPYVDSGSEYIPSTDEESETDMTYKNQKMFPSYLNTHEKQADVSSADIEIPFKQVIQISSSDLKIQNEQQIVKKSARKSVAKLMELDSSLSDEDSDGPIKDEIFVKSTEKTIAGARIYDKRHYCYFCYKPICKITRHLSTVHDKETEIARLLALPENSVERKEGFLCVLRAGDYYHNVEILATKNGELVLSRRPKSSNSFDYRKYGPCPNCLGFFLVSNLWHHIKYNCPKKTSLTQAADGKYISRRDIRGESYALISQNVNVSEDYKRNILANLRNDDIGNMCKEDKIILAFGSLLYEKYSAQQYEHIRQTMRQISRLVLEVSKLDPTISTLQEIMLPRHFDILITAVQQLCVANRNAANSRCYDIPSLALKLGHSLRKCALIVRGIALRKGDLTLNREMESFIDLMTLEWNIKISSAALRTLREKQMNAAQLLPITSDIMKLNSFLDIIIDDLVSDKNLMLSPQNWQKLAQATLCRIVLFNKRRSGEAARMTLQQYATRPNWSDQCTSELKESLTPLETNLANNLTVVEVVGKSRKNFKVPILLTHATKSAINKLIQTRDQVGIARDNIYVFARGSGSKKALRGHDCLRKFAKDAELEQPTTLTSTKLRKYIATVVQVLDLKSNEYDWLARHLSHDIRIHREFYRLHESAVELTKVSRLLLTLDKGEVNNFKGKSLDEINIGELPDLESEEENTVLSDDDELSDKDDTHEDPMLKRENICKNERITKKKSTGETKHQKKKNIPGTSKSTLPYSAKAHSKEIVVRRPWSQEEKEALLKFFRLNIKNKIVPNKVTSEKCIEENYPVLQSRSWKDVKNWIYNKIKSLK